MVSVRQRRLEPDVTQPLRSFCDNILTHKAGFIVVSRHNVRMINRMAPRVDGRFSRA